MKGALPVTFKTKGSNAGLLLSKQNEQTEKTPAIISTLKPSTADEVSKRTTMNDLSKINIARKKQ